jgi:Zn-finger nucleic acid-binding protein
MGAVGERPKRRSDDVDEGDERKGDEVASGDDGVDGDGRGLSCPVCGVALRTVVRQEVAIDRCPECRGIWLDRGELEKLVALGDDGGERYERPLGETAGEPEAAGKLATRRSFFAELFDVE